MFLFRVNNKTKFDENKTKGHHDKVSLTFDIRNGALSMEEFAKTANLMYKIIFNTLKDKIKELKEYRHEDRVGTKTTAVKKQLIELKKDKYLTGTTLKEVFRLAKSDDFGTALPLIGQDLEKWLERITINVTIAFDIFKYDFDSNSKEYGTYLQYHSKESNNHNLQYKGFLDPDFDETQLSKFKRMNRDYYHVGLSVPKGEIEVITDYDELDGIPKNIDGTIVKKMEAAKYRPELDLSQLIMDDRFEIPDDIYTLKDESAVKGEHVMVSNGNREVCTFSFSFQVEQSDRDIKTDKLTEILESYVLRKLTEVMNHRGLASKLLGQLIHTHISSRKYELTNEILNILTQKPAAKRKAEDEEPKRVAKRMKK